MFVTDLVFRSINSTHKNESIGHSLYHFYIWIREKISYFAPNSTTAEKTDQTGRAAIPSLAKVQPSRDDIINEKNKLLDSCIKQLEDLGISSNPLIRLKNVEYYPTEKQRQLAFDGLRLQTRTIIEQELENLQDQHEYLNSANADTTNLEKRICKIKTFLFPPREVLAPADNAQTESNHPGTEKHRAEIQSTQGNVLPKDELGSTGRPSTLSNEWDAASETHTEINHNPQVVNHIVPRFQVGNAHVEEKLEQINSQSISTNKEEANAKAFNESIAGRAEFEKALEREKRQRALCNQYEHYLFASKRILSRMQRDTKEYEAKERECKNWEKNYLEHLEKLQTLGEERRSLDPKGEYVTQLGRQRQAKRKADVEARREERKQHSQSRV